MRQTQMEQDGSVRLQRSLSPRSLSLMMMTMMMMNFYWYKIRLFSHDVHRETIARPVAL